MSRLAKKPITIPSGVEFKFHDQIVTVKGAKGTLSKEMPKGISIAHSGNELSITIDENQLDYPMWGLHHALIINMITGVTKGFQKKLSLVGVGYRANLKGDTLELALGFSHPSLLKIPTGIKVTVDKNVAILVEGCDAQQVGQFAANVRSIKPPEPYKGKGVRYENEVVRKKAGKTAKAK
ncbi:MAG: 50S ribosomal protein L6 [Chlamydiae bacterium]|jgi:large subunit ribosomal protein L6|nr:50S ribosomal protein L6 [Chlamydiota bacterium]